MHPELAIKCLDLADGFRSIVIEKVDSVLRSDYGIGQERFEILLHRNRSRSRSATAMWRRESLVQVDMQDIDAKVTGSCDSHHRIQVCAIHVHKGSAAVQNVRDLGDFGFKHS